MMFIAPYLLLAGQAYDVRVASHTSSTITLAFMEVPGARSYEYALSTTSPLAGFGAWTALTNTKQIAGLSASTQYWVKVRIANGVARGPASPVATGTTDSSGGISRVHIVADTSTSASGFTATFSENLGTGSKFLVIGVLAAAGTANTTTDISVNGHSFAPVTADNAQGSTLWAGTVTVTGTDSIVLTASVDLSFLDINIHVYSIAGLASTTPVVASNGVALASTVSAVGVNAGDIVIALGTNGGSAPSFAGSAQVPDNSYNEVATFGQNTCVADWIAASTATFVATLNASTQPIIAVWR